MSTLLDATIVYDLLHPSLEQAMEWWIGDCQATDLHFSSVGEPKLPYSIAILPEGNYRVAPTRKLRRSDTPVRPCLCTPICGHCRHAQDRWAHRCTCRQSDCGDHLRLRLDGGDPHCARFRGYWYRGHQSLGVDNIRTLDTLGHVTTVAAAINQAICHMGHLAAEGHVLKPVHGGLGTEYALLPTAVWHMRQDDFPGCIVSLFGQNQQSLP